MTDVAVLLSDPVFQLNTMLWALEDIADTGEIHPVLGAVGYYASALGRRVIVPVDSKSVTVLEQLTGSRDRSPSHPDLWLKHATDPVQPIVELKARGFAIDSSNTRQATKLLISSADLAPSLGGGDRQPGHVIYATVEDDAEPLAQTLDQLKNAIEQADIPTAPSSTIAFVWTDAGVALACPRPNELPGPARAALADPAVVLETNDPDDDVRPLYLIPWMPGLDESQDPELRSDGYRELTARVLSQAVAIVGRSSVPTTVAFTGSQLMDGATFGIFARWRDSDRSQFAKAAARIVERALRATGHVQLEGEQVDVDLPTTEAHEAVINRLEKADPADPAKNLEAATHEAPTLFDAASEASGKGARAEVPLNP